MPLPRITMARTIGTLGITLFLVGISATAARRCGVFNDQSPQLVCSTGCDAYWAYGLLVVATKSSTPGLGTRPPAYDSSSGYSPVEVTAEEAESQAEREREAIAQEVFICRLYSAAEKEDGMRQLFWCLLDWEAKGTQHPALIATLRDQLRLYTGAPAPRASWLGIAPTRLGRSPAVVCAPPLVIWLGAALTLLVLMRGLVRRVIRYARVRRGRCCCGYDLTGNVSGTCPECGTRVPTAVSV